MRLLIQRFSASPLYIKVTEWGRLLTITGSAQMLVQAVGLLSGILIIRVLTPGQYALYTLANTMIGTMAVLADSGISSGIMSEGRRVWQDRTGLGAVMSTGMLLRKKFVAATLIAVLPFLFFLLQRHGAGWFSAALISVSVIPAFYAAQSAALLQIPHKFHQDIGPLQRNVVEMNAGRLVLLLLSIFAFPFAFVAILSAAIPQVIANARLRKMASGYADFAQQPDTATEKKVLALVKRMLPMGLYYCLSGQITIWLISVFGSTDSIAKAGALGRLAMLLNLVNVVFSTLIIPRFVRLPNTQRKLLLRYVQTLSAVIVLGAAIVAVVSLFPKEILWVLGQNYSGLSAEIILNIAGSCLALIAGCAYLLNSGRGWAINPALSIGISIAAIVISAWLNDLSSLRGVLLMNIYIAAAEAVMHVSYGLFRIRSIKQHHNTSPI